MRYFIVDDDKASRTMLKKIIIEGELGMVIGEADSGISALTPILTIQPDVVLIDLLMPELDGIETMEQLISKGFKGSFIMISQVVNKEMVGEAYEKGVEFFIHKPINRLEVQSVLKKTTEQHRLKDSLYAIKASLAMFEQDKTISKQQSIKEIVLSILNEMGVIAEAGSEDIVALMEIMMNRGNDASLPPLKELYEARAKEIKSSPKEIQKECKAIEQRIRRTITAAVHHLASLGSIDYTNPEFEYYAPRFFDLQEIRSYMIHMEEKGEGPIKVRINNKKFLQMLFLETLEKVQGRNSRKY